ncbi:MAG: SDR family NAD(P)-dependent oxidoreductase, partial [Anaerolineae bacterium]|nr:SDR family NAD(P)-dependent oxidoreductase [Anaerolineae bacterium]
MTAPFFDQVVLLTGASSGIGEQIAYQLAEQGARLMLTARRADRLAAVAQVCQSRGAQTTFLALDLTDPAAAERLVNETVQHYGRIDMLLYNAGGGHPGRFDALPNLESIQTEIALNYLGLIACVHHALPHLKQTRGRLVAVASFGGLMALSGSAGYNAAKHALRGFLNTLRVELRGTGISVTVIYPG